MKLSKLFSSTIALTVSIAAFSASAMERNTSSKTDGKEHGISAAAAAAAAHILAASGSTVAASASSTKQTQSIDRQCANSHCKSQKTAEKKCARCKTTYYCSKDCQKVHWPVHKASCNRVHGLTARSSASNTTHAAAAGCTSAATAASLEVAEDQTYMLELDGTPMKFAAPLIHQSKMLTDMIGNNKDEKNIPLSSDDIKISLQELHDVLEIIADPARRPLRDVIGKYLQDKNLASFCSAASYLNIEPLSNIATELCAEQFIKCYRQMKRGQSNNWAKLYKELKQLPDDIQYLISAHVINNPNLRLGNVRQLLTFIRPMTTHKLKEGVDEGSLSPDGMFCASCQKDDNKITIRRTSDGSLVSNYASNWLGKINIRWSADGTKIACAYKNIGNFGNLETIDIWNPLTGENIARVQAPFSIVHFDISPDCSKVACTGDYYTKKEWCILDAKTGAQLFYDDGKKSPDSFSFRDIKFSPDGNFIALVHGDSIKIFDIRSEKIIKECKASILSSIDWAPDNKSIAYSNQNICIWNVHDEKIITSCCRELFAYEVKFSKDGKYIATWSDDERDDFYCYVKILNTHDCTPLNSSFLGAKIIDMTFNHNSTGFTTCSPDRICTWNIDNRLPLCTIEDLVKLMQTDTRLFFETIESQAYNGGHLELDAEQTAQFHQLPRSVQDFILKQFTSYALRLK